MKNIYLISRRIFFAHSKFCFRNNTHDTNRAALYYNGLSVRTYCQKDNSASGDKMSHKFEKEQEHHAYENIQNDNAKFNGKEHTDQNQESTLKVNILNASLSYIKTSGWTAESLSKGAEALGYSRMVYGMFENGATDLVNYYYESCNIKLEEKLSEILREQQLNKEKLRTTKFIKQAIELRLRMNIEYIDSWPQALSLHMAPSNAGNALENVGNLLDTIWYHAGDRSVDFDWYSKRLILGAVYKSTEMCMIQDKSEDFQETWAFLDRRLAEVGSSAKFFGQLSNVGKDVACVSQAGFLTALNIIGLNSKSR